VERADASDWKARQKTRRVARRAVLRVVALVAAVVVAYFTIELIQGSLTKNEAAPWITLGGMFFLLVLFLGEWPLFSDWLDRKLGPEDGVAWPEQEPLDRRFALGNALPVPGQMVLTIFLFADGFGIRGGGKLRRAYVPFSHIVKFMRTPTFQISLGATKWSTIVYERNGRTRSVGIMNPTFDMLQQAHDEWKRHN
jgi:hypothetical protein